MGRNVNQEFRPLPLADVIIDDTFWAPRIKVNREHSIPHIYAKCKETGRIDAFKLNWKPGVEPAPHIFWDSDVAKWIEAASYSLATHPEPKLNSLLDKVIALVADAQQPDGYLNTHFTVVEPQKRWANLRDWHELYCAGHLIEAGAAHFRATGKRTLLDVVSGYAGYIDTVFGTEDGKKRGYPGHEEIELALIKLYRLTGQRKYLNLSKYFVDERGRKPYYFDIEALDREEALPESSSGYISKHQRYVEHQAHLPVREQADAVGHAVRAMYLYSAMADLAAEFKDEKLLRACERLWESACNKRMYITGGIGSISPGEAFSLDYDLPNETAYAETCAAIGLVLWSHRMLQFDCDGRYSDVMERALYNGVTSGVSLDGKKFFYVNPLASLGNHHRQEWFECACCPTNIARLLASLGQCVYSQSETEAAIHLYIQGEGKFNLAGRNVVLHQRTNYPWGGMVKIEVRTGIPLTFGLRIRIPSWCKRFEFRVNGKAVSVAGKLERGYIRIRRNWEDGDDIEINLSMPVELIRAHPEVRQDTGCVTLQRGPIVYCLEEVDNNVPLHRIILPVNTKLESHFDKNLLGGVVAITGNARVLDDCGWGGMLYSAKQSKTKSFRIKAVPYCTWDNRKAGEMRVWIHKISTDFPLIVS